MENDVRDLIRAIAREWNVSRIESNVRVRLGSEISGEDMAAWDEADELMKRAVAGLRRIADPPASPQLMAGIASQRELPGGDVSRREH
jgi:hypothetical protein